MPDDNQPKECRLATSSKIKVMLSSRCVDPFPAPGHKDAVSLTEIRKTLKKEIEAEKLFGKKAFEVWINEDAPPANHSVDSWEQCLKEVRDCDILVVLYNGNAGWAKDAASVGICHAEYMEGLSTAPGKVSLVELPATAATKPDQAARDKRFAVYHEQQSPFRGGSVANTKEQLIQLVRDAVRDAVVALAQRGVKAEASSRFDRGQALDWSRLDFRDRSARMRKVLADALLVDGKRLDDHLVSIKVDAQLVAFKLHAVPAALSISAAREMVGRPFLADHEHLPKLGAAAGPVHLIACHRSATEAQAINLLGFPDATVVSGSFGIYVADEIQKVQFIFLKNCRDESQLRHNIQRFMAWLDQTGEGTLLASRATSRKKIIQAIKAEL